MFASRRWEVPIDAVLLDGQKLPVSTQAGAGLDRSLVSGLIDTVRPLSVTLLSYTH